MRDNKRCVYYIFHIFNIPNVLLIITEILAHIAQFPKRIDALKAVIDAIKKRRALKIG
jgi:hypothetical protein